MLLQGSTGKSLLRMLDEDTLETCRLNPCPPWNPSAMTGWKDMEVQNVIESTAQQLTLTDRPMWAQQQCWTSTVSEPRAVHTVWSPLADGFNTEAREGIVGAWQWDSGDHSQSSSFWILSLGGALHSQGWQLGAGLIRHQPHLRVG